MTDTGNWCVDDDHAEWSRQSTFNGWLESGDEEAIAALDRLGLVAFSSPSKALFAGDRLLYRQELERFRTLRRSRILGDGTFDEHWVARNRRRFDQILLPLRANNIVPFVGAGVSCASHFPGWSAHLANQAVSAGFAEEPVTAALMRGDYEDIIEDIVSMRGEAVFIQELKDEFDRPPIQVDLAGRIARLTSSLIATTNYDFVMQTAMNAVDGRLPELLSGTEESNQGLVSSMINRRRSILMLHGAIKRPQTCIIRRTQYDRYYGSPLDLTGPVPKKIKALYEQRSLLFIGCSLNLDRTLSVFREIRRATAAEDLPQHFAFVEVAPETDAVAARNVELTDIGITPIFFPKGRHDLLSLLIEELLEEADFIH